MAEVTKGNIYLGDTPVIILSDDKIVRFKNVIEKMIRGIYRQHFDQILPNNYRILSHMLDDAYLFDNLDDPILKIVWPKVGKTYTVGGERVQYRYRISEEQEEISVWSILFYGRVLMYAIVYPEHMKEQFK